MTLPRPPVADRFTVEQYLDGQWYVMAAHYPARGGKLIFGPYLRRHSAIEVYWSLVESYTEDRW